MGKKRKKSKKETIELAISVPQNKQFELISFPLISLLEDYKVYRVVVEGETIGYFGLFSSGNFNYIVVREKSEINETQLLIFLKSFIKNVGLTPTLNPHFVA